MESGHWLVFCLVTSCQTPPHGPSVGNEGIFLPIDMVLDSGEFCEWPKLNTRGYPCTLGGPTQSIRQKGYPLAQAHCTAFASTASLFVWFAPASEQAPMAAC